MNRRIIIGIYITVIVSTLLILSYVNFMYSVRVISGDSMGAQYDDIVIVDTSVTWDDIDDGDIISFVNECGYSTHHRLVYDDINDNWKTQGDNTGMYDIGDCYQNPVKPDDFESKIIGKKVAGINLPFF